MLFTNGQSTNPAAATVFAQKVILVSGEYRVRALLSATGPCDIECSMSGHPTQLFYVDTETLEVDLGVLPFQASDTITLAANSSGTGKFYCTLVIESEKSGKVF